MFLSVMIMLFEIWFDAVWMACCWHLLFTSNCDCSCVESLQNCWNAAKTRNFMELEAHGNEAKASYWIKPIGIKIPYLIFRAWSHSLQKMKNIRVSGTFGWLTTLHLNMCTFNEDDIMICIFRQFDIDSQKYSDTFIVCFSTLNLLR